MTLGPQALLVAATAAVGVLHTLVPDHWAPLALIARQRGWSARRTARAAALAGVGHTVSTLVIAVVVWFAGIAVAARFGNLVELLVSGALITFGAWTAIAALREQRSQRGHSHIHRHADGSQHVHWHDHEISEAHDESLVMPTAPPLHTHEHSTSSRTALLLILGSSPMIEGIPAFFAAARYGAPLLVVMSVVFALATIGTYVALSVAAVVSLKNLTFGPLERYGEVLSGVVIATLGIVFAIWFRGQ
jgi:ABC-type nickel/cobalt efflux system permease component RcnA